MKNFSKFLGLSVLTLVVGSTLLVFCSKFYFDLTKECVKLDQNFRVTVNIDTPEGIKSGSTVRNIRNYACKNRRPKIGGSGNPAQVTGEAVVIDLGERGKVFALINHQADSEFYQVFYGTGSGATTFDGMKKYVNLPNGTKGTLNPDKFPGYPWFVMFKDINDPMSVTLVRGSRFEAETQTHHPVRDFEKVFGNGVRVASIQLQITDKSLYPEISNELLWLDNLGGHYLHGGMTSREAPLGLHAGHFKHGVKNDPQ